MGNEKKYKIPQSRNSEYVGSVSIRQHVNKVQRIKECSEDESRLVWGGSSLFRKGCDLMFVREKV